MNNANPNASSPKGARTDSGGVLEKVQRTLPKRYRAERRFRLYGLMSIAIAVLFLVVLLISWLQRRVARQEREVA